MPAGAPLSSPEAWTRLIDGLAAADWPDGIDHGPALAGIVDLLSRGIEAAAEAGETLLRRQARAIWRRALAAGPAASLDLTLETLKQDDGIDPCVSACWMPASALAASPRRFVRLLGLNSARWPRAMVEDRLISDHIVPTAELDPLPLAAADRRDFATILATTESEIVLSRDRRDTLALGALMRGPLVGLTEEELLDIVWALPRAEDAPDNLPRLDLGVAPEVIGNPLARDIMEKLQALQRRVNATTPHALLSQAVDVLRVRPILLRRHRGQAERALANVDLYLSFSRAYAVRGLRAFAEAMTAAWSDEARAVEGRPDAPEDAVALYTMHAAKGLEWPIVVPINTMTRVMPPESALTDRASGRFYCRVFGVEPAGYETARDDEKAELDRERVRLWYVASTRARELLVLPRLDVDAAASAWLSVVDLGLPELPALDLDHLPPAVGVAEPDTRNRQTRAVFAAEAAAIAERTHAIVWWAPSRDEGPAQSVPVEELPTILATDGDGAPADGLAPAAIQGGRERGLILHKLIEEVLTGETVETMPDLVARAEFLVSTLGRPVMEDPAQGLAPAELAGCVLRALSLPEVAALSLRPSLVPEFTVYASSVAELHEEAAAGIVDAIAFGADGKPEVVIDWKSDVDPTPETVEHYRAQVHAYLEMTGAERGLVVFMTSGIANLVVRTG